MHDNVYDNNLAAVASGIAVAILLACGLFGLCFARRRYRKCAALRRADATAGTGGVVKQADSLVAARSAVA